MKFGFNIFIAIAIIYCYRSLDSKLEMDSKLADFSGKWKMKSSEHFEELLKALGEFSLDCHSFVYFLGLKCIDI